MLSDAKEDLKKEIDLIESESLLEKVQIYIMGMKAQKADADRKGA